MCSPLLLWILTISAIYKTCSQFHRLWVVMYCYYQCAGTIDRSIRPDQTVNIPGTYYWKCEANISQLIQLFKSLLILILILSILFQFWWFDFLHKQLVSSNWLEPKPQLLLWLIDPWLGSIGCHKKLELENDFRIL